MFVILKRMCSPVRLSNEQRAAIADYFRVYKVALHHALLLIPFLAPSRNLFNPMNLSQGGENALKKVSLAGTVVHPFLAYALPVSSVCLIYQHSTHNGRAKFVIMHM